MTQKTTVKPSLFMALIPVFVLIGILTLNIQIFSDNATYGPNQLALLFAACTASIIGLFVLKMDYKFIEEKIIHSIGLSMQANLILLVVGMLIGLWIFSGVVPAMIYYGVKLISPAWFLPITCIVCSIVSVATGSSWSTGGTVGIALIGIGKTIGIPEGMVAGAVISGAYFGDKLSPLSDTTNLAPAMAGTDLFTHVRYMLYTTIPSMIIAILGFVILGFFFTPQEANLETIQGILTVLETNFNLNPLLFALPVLVFAMVAKKIPAIPALLVGAIGGAIFTVIFQQELLSRVLGGEVSFKGVYQQIIAVAFGGFKIETGNLVIDKLLSRGGMSGMLNTVWLIIMAMVFGGVMECTGLLGALAGAIMKFVRGTASLIAATLASCFMINLTAADQYLSIVIPGKMFKQSYEDMGLAPQNLSRSLEDAGTITSVLVPWNTCGAYFATVLGVSHMAFIPFCFFNLVNPIVSVVIAALGWKIARIGDNPESTHAHIAVAAQE